MSCCYKTVTIIQKYMTMWPWPSPLIVKNVNCNTKIIKDKKWQVWNFLQYQTAGVTAGWPLVENPWYIFKQFRPRSDRSPLIRSYLFEHAKGQGPRKVIFCSVKSQNLTRRKNATSYNICNLWLTTVQNVHWKKSHCSFSWFFNAQKSGKIPKKSSF